MSVNIDLGISEIIKSANDWIIKIQDKKVKKRANILLSAGLLVLMVKKLQNIFIDIMEEHLIYNESWPIEAKQQIQKRIMDYAIKTDIVDRISFHLKELENYKTQGDFSEDIEGILHELWNGGAEIREKAGFARTSYIDRELVDQVIDLINSNAPYPDLVRSRLRGALYETFKADDTRKLFEILGILISEIRLEYPDIPYPEWLINTLITYEKF